MKRVLEADTWWGVSAVVWIGTGLLRRASTFARISQVQTALIVGMVAAAAMIARGFGVHG